MGSFSIWHWVIVAIVVLLLFGGRGKLSSLMGDAAKGIRAFRDGHAAVADEHLCVLTRELVLGGAGQGDVAGSAPH